MSFYSQYACEVCGNIRTYGTGYPDDITAVVLIRCGGKCQSVTLHKYKEAGDKRMLGGLTEMTTRS